MNNIQTPTPPITHDDPLYGPTIIHEPVLCAVMNTHALQRLHGVLQHGITALVGITKQITRFDHSVGAMCLVRRLGGPVEEQIAALLHDVSHTIFSHVIDHVLDSAATQSYHDQIKESYLAGTDVPHTLAQYGYDWRAFVDETQFPLLEQPAPALCADRLDYFLRDAQPLGLATPAEVQRALAHLVVCDGRIAVDDVAVARWLGDTFMAADDASWSSFLEVGLYELTARALRRALELGVLTQEQLWLTDQVAWQKLQASPDAELQRWLQLVRPETRFAWDAAAPDFEVCTKIRTIDPDVFHEGQLKPLSAWDKAYAQRRVEYLQRKQGTWPMRVIPHRDEKD